MSLNSSAVAQAASAFSVLNTGPFMDITGDRADVGVVKFPHVEIRMTVDTERGAFPLGFALDLPSNCRQQSERRLLKLATHVAS